MLMMKSMQLFTVGAMAFLASTASTRGLEIGDAAPGFRLPGIDGNFHALADFKSKKAVVVTFWCNHCPVVLAYEDRAIDLVKKFSVKDIAFVMVNSNDTRRMDGADNFAAMKKHAKEKSYNFPYLLDATQATAKAYGATCTPHVFVVDASGKVAYQGAIDDSARDAAKAKKHYLADALDAIVSGRKIPTVATKQVGCGVKWSEDAMPAAAKGELKPGAKAPSFVLVGVDGAAFDSQSVKEKFTAIVFTCNTCPVAVQAELPLIETAKQYQARGVRFVAISSNDREIKPADDFPEMKKRASEKGYPFPYLFDETQAIARGYGATCTPHVFVIDASHTVRYEGALMDLKNKEDKSKHYLANALDSLLAGEKPTVASTEQQGCGIKWRTVSKAG